MSCVAVRVRTAALAETERVLDERITQVWGDSVRGLIGGSPAPAIETGDGATLTVRLAGPDDAERAIAELHVAGVYVPDDGA